MNCQMNERMSQSDRKGSSAYTLRVRGTCNWPILGLPYSSLFVANILRFYIQWVSTLIWYLIATKSVTYFESESCSVMSDSVQLTDCSPWNSSPGQNTGVGSLSFLQQIFLTQESNWSLLHCRQILYQLTYQGSCYLL